MVRDICAALQCLMARGGVPSKRRQRGAIDQLPSGSFRVRVYSAVQVGSAGERPRL